MLIYNALGQKVRTLVAGRQVAGWHTVTWDGTNAAGQPVSSGIYLYRFSARAASGAGHTAVRKMLLVR